jgi:ribosomal protein L7/L12
MERCNRRRQETKVDEMTEYTPQQRAIRQWLSKPAPNYGGCGCMGPQRLDGKWDHESVDADINIYSMGDTPIKVVQVLRADMGMTLFDAKKLLDAKRGLLEKVVNAEKVDSNIRAAGGVCQIITPISNLEPECPCEMRTVEVVDGVYYKIIEHRSPDGITHEAFEIGPIGGPYKKVTK